MLCHQGLWAVQWCALWIKRPVSTYFAIFPPFLPQVVHYLSNCPHSLSFPWITPSAAFLFSVLSLLPTYDTEVTCHFFGSKAVGDLADVVAAVFNSQFGDGEAGDAPCPAGVRRQRPTVLQPSDGWVWVSGRNAGQLYAVAHLHLARLETVQHWWCGLRRVCSNTSYRLFSILLFVFLFSSG